MAFIPVVHRGDKIALLRRAGTDPPGHARRPRWVAQHLQGGGLMHEGMPTMTDSSGVLALLAAAVPAGPRDHELMSLHELALRVGFYGNMDPFHADSRTIAALLGDDDLQGLPPSSLRLYHRYFHGPVLLDPKETEFQGVYGPVSRSPRSTALRHISIGRIWHERIDDIPAGTDDQVAGRFLAVVRVDALAAFGLNPPAAPSPVEPPPPPVPGATEPPATAEKNVPDLTHIAAVYLEEVRLKPHGAIERAAARLKRLDGAPMGRTTLVKRLKQANAAGFTTGYPQDR